MNFMKNCNEEIDLIIGNSQNKFFDLFFQYFFEYEWNNLYQYHFDNLIKYILTNLNQYKNIHKKVKIKKLNYRFLKI